MPPPYLTRRFRGHVGDRDELHFGDLGRDAGVIASHAANADHRGSQGASSGRHPCAIVESGTVDVLLTGGSGFVGRHLVARWRGAHHVHVLGRTPVEGATHISCDLTLGLDRARLPSRFDVVVHLATSQAATSAIFRVNTQATLELLEAAVVGGASRFILASTGTVYGWREADSDEDTPLAPRDLYSHSKVMAEELVRAHRDHLATDVLRLYMPYGAGQRDRLFADLVRRVRDGRVVELSNGGAPVLNPIHMDDLMEVFDHALQAPGHALLNVGGAEALSIRQMAETIGDSLGIAPRFEDRERPGEPTRLVGKIDRLCAWLGHGPRVSFAAGVARSLRPA